MRPFSNGTEAMIWYDENCTRCSKAYFPKDGEYPSDQTMKKYCSIGKECKLKYAIDWAFVTSEIPDEVAAQIGESKYGLKSQCMMFSDNDDDRYRPPKKPRPRPINPDQKDLFPMYPDERNYAPKRVGQFLKNFSHETAI